MIYLISFLEFFFTYLQKVLRKPHGYGQIKRIPKSFSVVLLHSKTLHCKPVAYSDVCLVTMLTLYKEGGISQPPMQLTYWVSYI